VKNIIFITLLLTSGYSFAETIIVTIPTQRSDSTPLGLSEIANIQVKYGTTTGVYTMEFTHTVIASPETVIQFDIDAQKPPGTYFVTVTINDIYGSDPSPDSNEITKVLQFAPPKPATIR